MVVVNQWHNSHLVNCSLKRINVHRVNKTLKILKSSNEGPAKLQSLIGYSSMLTNDLQSRATQLHTVLAKVGIHSARGRINSEYSDSLTIYCIVNMSDFLYMIHSQIIT